MHDPHRDETSQYEQPQVEMTAGTMVGGYRVEALLGVGGMGTVYRATDLALGRPVALKLLCPAIDTPDARERLLREARAAAAVVHDHVIRIYQVGEDHGTPFIAMELLAGGSLADRLAHGPVPPAEVIRIAVQAANGLAAIHAAGLVHRDVKPANLWVEAGTQRVKLLDFGLARSDRDAAITRPGTVLGSPAYMAPEQARGEAVDHRADLFSLGCVLYHLATGRRPFDGPNTLAVLTALATHNPSPADAVNAAVPRALAEFIDHLLTKDPTARPPTATDVVRRLATLDLTAPRLVAVLDVPVLVTRQSTPLDPTAPPVGSHDSTQSAITPAASTDRRRMLAMLLELKEHIVTDGKPTLLGWVVVALLTVGFPLLLGYLGYLVAKEQHARKIAADRARGVLTYEVLLPDEVNPGWAVVGGLAGVVLGPLSGAWYAWWKWRRKRDALIEALLRAFPEETADWGGAPALRDMTLLTAIISRVQGL